MPDYDFKSLSPWEFEQLSRDLLKASLGIDFELFKSGRDQGIDLRYSKYKSNDIIVQCKHYSNSNFASLISNLKKDEKSKIDKLSPRRYILITSLGLTPKNKDDITETLHPHIISYGDIITKETLNGWLGEHPEIEISHLKLWTTSSAIMERIIHSGIFNYTRTQIDELEEKIKFHVKSKCFETALATIEDQGFCIIAGIPGIGKTTLAEMLLIDFIRRGYEPIRITSDINEAFDRYNPTKSQAFYYDDFLGQIGLENKLNKNEDQRITDFCKICSKNEHTIIIMTTREYILNQAKITYEKLERSKIDLKKCVIDLSSYALMDRAKILYNHLYFRNIPKPYIDEIIKDRKYLHIIKHTSFNPRVIEWMTDNLSISTIPASEYYNNFIYNLDHPDMIWNHAYNNQISEESRHLLITVLSLPNIVMLKDCRNAFEKLRIAYCNAYKKPNTHSEFQRALKECEGNFIRTGLSGNNQTIQFHNPSIRDYLTYLLSNDLDLMKILIQSFTIFDQSVSLWNSLKSLTYNPLYNDQELAEIFQCKLAETLNSNTIKLIATLNHYGNYNYVYDVQNKPHQIKFILTENLGHAHKTLIEKTKEHLNNYFSNLDSIYDWSIITSILYAIKNAKPDYELEISKYIKQTIDVLPYKLNQVNDYRQMAEICDHHPLAYESLVGNFLNYTTTLKENFNDELQYINSTNDSVALEQCMDDIETIAEIFDVDLSYCLDELKNAIEEINQQSTQETEQNVSNHVHHSEIDNHDDVISMFETFE